MTESKATQCLRKIMQTYKKEFGNIDPAITDLYKTTINALKKIQQYRSIGTVEECREAMEKQKAKALLVGNWNRQRGKYNLRHVRLPDCGKSYNIVYNDCDYCPECGQAFDRSDIHG